MTLAVHLTLLRALNAELIAALSAADIDRCLTLMTERGEVLAAFGDAHQTASADELATIQTEIVALRQEEERLQQLFQEARANLGQQLLQPQQPRPSGQAVDPLCIDRRA